MATSADPAIAAAPVSSMGILKNPDQMVHSAAHAAWRTELLAARPKFFLFFLTLAFAPIAFGQIRLSDLVAIVFY